ncbi:S1 family peptidase [Streptomyces sp. FIT100]|uniref:S1 family peptidase n=1 Tax=Streptomyces sp. FIT100 TaxID=2837956 RepID=UPI0021C722E4|nr:S1 family peptidase [Streptomyces sp. FIT100]UUN30653.1 alpha-lytic protease prodomain-containing protein [Streptomyces sp. FIT100]
MRHARRNLQRIARLAAVGGLLWGSLMVSGAMAGEPSAPGTGASTTSGPPDPAAALVARLGTDRTAGSWTRADGRPVVAVTDTDAAAEVRRAGAEAEVVRHSTDRLRAATDALGAAPRVPGTAWSVEYASNEVVVHADSTVSAADWSRLSGLAESIGAFVRMERAPGAFTTRLNGAAPMFAENSRCSAGFNVTDGRRAFILTAGHCGSAGTVWSGGRRRAGQLGTTVASSFPGDDFSLVRYEDGESVDGTVPGIVEIGGGQGVRIVGAAEAVVGRQVFRSGSTTGLRTGRVTAVNATVNYPEGTVTGLIETTVCAEPGDSGGPLFAQGLALGVTSGGNGDCTTGGVTYFQPVTEAMAALGVSLAGQAPAGADGPDPGRTEPSAPADPPSSAAAVPPAAGGEGGTGTAGAAGGGAAVQPPAGASGPGIVTDIAAGLGPLGAVAPGIGVIGVSLILLIASRWIKSAQGRRNYRDYYSRTWA